MNPETIVLLFFLFLIIATLYSTVGHAGASGYLAIMALLSFAPESIKPTSLILNVVVAAIASIKFIRAGCFDKHIFLAFIITSIPLSFMGGYLTISPKYFKLIAGLFLIFSAFLLFFKTYLNAKENRKTKQMPFAYGLILGSIIGLISGLIGVGGGIFLSPLLLLTNWTTVKNASGVSALFILLNSLAGLAGHFSALHHIDGNIFIWVIAVLIGGFIGSYLGTIKFNNKIIITCLFLVLLTAGIKFVFVDFSN